MRNNYIIRCEVEVNASNDDVALELLQDILNIGGLTLHRWVDTTLNERESNE
jgi:hypothetical protein